MISYFDLKFSIFRMSIYHDEVEIEDMEYDEETGIFMNIFRVFECYFYTFGFVCLRVVLLSLSVWRPVSNLFGKEL